MGGKGDDICIVKVIQKYFPFTTLTFVKFFLFCEWFVAFSSLICICKMLTDSAVIHYTGKMVYRENKDAM